MGKQFAGTVPFREGDIMYDYRRYGPWVLLLVILPVGVGAIPACAEEKESPQGKAVAAEEASPPEAPEVKPRTRKPPPGARAYIAERKRMVRTQIAEPRDSRTVVRSPAVLEAMRNVPRHVFVPASMKSRAYADSPLPIGHGQTISQPYIVAWMTELLELKSDSKVLEIGTGSGYQAAVLAHLTSHVYTVEIIQALHERAKSTFKEQGYREVECRHADGYHGWEEKGPFDAIIVTCAAGHLPPPLWDQLKPGGRIVIPIGGPYEMQRLVLVTKDEEGKRKSKTLSYVRFVPLTRSRGEEDS
jgi:protein-L-isoaspartate(D-aspartate) O-methyltransferase